MAENMIPKPSVGRIVHCLDDGVCIPAMITLVGEDDQVKLTVFPPDALPVYTHEFMDKGNDDHTWHWPERV